MYECKYHEDTIYDLSFHFYLVFPIQFLCQVWAENMHLICLCILLVQFWSSNTFAFNCDTDDYKNEDYCYSTPDDDQPLLQRQRRAVNFYQTGKKVQNDMSRTLDQIFGSNYNRKWLLIFPAYVFNFMYVIYYILLTTNCIF